MAGTGLVQLNSDGTLVSTLNISSRSSGSVNFLQCGRDGSVFLGGSFEQIEGHSNSDFARIYMTPFRVRPILASPVTSAGAFNFTLKGEPDRQYVIETSPDLNQWSNDETNSNPMAIRNHSAPNDQRSRFFRARVLAPLEAFRTE
jgi:hypothetical protein